MLPIKFEISFQISKNLQKVFENKLKKKSSKTKFPKLADKEREVFNFKKSVVVVSNFFFFSILVCLSIIRLRY